MKNTRTVIVFVILIFLQILLLPFRIIKIVAKLFSLIFEIISDTMDFTVNNSIQKVSKAIRKQ